MTIQDQNEHEYYKKNGDENVSIHFDQNSQEWALYSEGTEISRLASDDILDVATRWENSTMIVGTHDECVCAKGFDGNKVKIFNSYAFGTDENINFNQIRKSFEEPKVGFVGIRRKLLIPGYLKIKFIKPGDTTSEITKISKLGD